MPGWPDASAGIAVTGTVEAAAPPAGRVATALPPALLPAAVATALAVVAIVLRWRGSDLPAHFFRVAIVERDGFEVWNNLWYGGHHTLGYGVLFPLLGSVVGIWTVAVASAGASAFLADVLLRQGTGRRCSSASLWFAAGTVTNVAIGRLPFALGLAVALGALVATQRRRMLVTAVLTLATAAASPVVSAFLALVFLAWAWSSDGPAAGPAGRAVGHVDRAGAAHRRDLPAGWHVPVPLASPGPDARRLRGRPGARAGRRSSSCAARGALRHGRRGRSSSCRRRWAPT